MIIYNKGNKFNYELEKLSRLFLPFERIDVVDTPQSAEIYAETLTENTENGCNLSAKLNFYGKKTSYSSFEPKGQDFEKRCQLSLATMLFNCFVEITKYKPEWGILTGVRPARLFLSKVDLLGITEAEKYFSNVLKVSDKKISLLMQTAESEEKIISLSKDNSFSLYISIPFCPSRCSYCSFVSHSIEKANEIIPKYLELLCVEIENTAKIVKDLGLNLETVYIGGGTPTTLSDKELSMVIDSVYRNFDTSNIREFTVEAGRPDTITEEKLRVIKEANVSRISINPQTLNDSVLKTIGRNHTSKQFFDSYNLARKIGFDNINTDLIAGLPSDDVNSFKNTIDRIIELSPENVTVHSLSMKRASYLTKNNELPDFSVGIDAGIMVNYAREQLAKVGILPYYMYRQSKTVGNLENIGYAKSGFEGLYNVFIMDETHTIFACGASATTKLKNSINGNIKRYFNFKYPYEYINRFDEMILRKKEAYDFYKK